MGILLWLLVCIAIGLIALAVMVVGYVVSDLKNERY